MAAKRDAEITINKATGEIMVHLHGHDVVGWEAAQKLLEADLGKARRIDKRPDPIERVTHTHAR